MDRVANLSQYNSQFFFLSQTTNRIADERIQVSSGYQSQDYAGISGDASRLVSMKAEHARTQQYETNNKLVGDRLTTMESSVAQVYDIVGSIKTLLVNALNGTSTQDVNLPGQAQSMLDQVSSLLNVQLDGRYLFAGGRSDTAPVDLSALPSSYTVPTSAGDASSYYQGDTTRLAVQASDSLSVTYGVTAGESGFEELIRGLDLAAKSAPNDRAALQDALATINRAQQDIPEIRTQIGAAQSSLDRINSMHDDFMTYTVKAISDIENVDVTEALTKIQNDSTGLQASYMTINTLSQLNLMNYLR
jgi:flagellar hook-associated protein 3 FlgL